MNKNTLLVSLVFAVSAAGATNSEDTVRAFLRYQYGADVPNITDICLPSKDLWMLKGKANPQQQKLVGEAKMKVSVSGLFMDAINQDICIVEMKDGKVDPRFNLEGVYGVHRRLIMQFFYWSLLQEKEELSRLVTNVDNISFGGVPKAGGGDMDVYSGILGAIPIVRSSAPGADTESRSVSYCLPLGDRIFDLTIVRHEGLWKIDTAKKLTVPLQFFWK